MKRALALAVLLLAAAVAQAATLTTVTVRLTTPTGTPPARTAGTYTEFDLLYCGTQARVLGTAVMPVTQLRQAPDATGLVTVQLYGNDQITCGTATGGTRWLVTQYIKGIPSPGLRYYITGASFDLDTAIAENDAAPPPPDSTLLPLLANAGGDQSMTVLPGAFWRLVGGGTVDFTGVNVAGLTISSGGTDASATVKGVVKLSNDFGGTADAPAVVGTHLASPLPTAQGGTGNSSGDAATLNGVAITGPLTGAKCLHSIDSTHIGESSADCGSGSGGLPGSPNALLDPTSASEAAPRRFGFSPAMGAGQAVRYEWGDANNGVQNSYNRRLQFYSYRSMVFEGNRQTIGAPAFEDFASPEAAQIFRGTRPDSVVGRVEASSGQSANIWEWYKGDGTLALSLAADGTFTHNSGDGGTYRTGTFNATVAPYYQKNGTALAVQDLAGSVNLTSAGQGYFYGGIVYASGAATAAVLDSVANQVRVFQFVLPFAVTVRNVAFEVTTVGTGTADVGIYDASKNKLISTGGVSTAAGTFKSTALGSPVTLLPGVYYFAWTCSDTTTQVREAALGTTINLLGNANIFGTAANAAAGGVLPATLGTITGTTGGAWNPPLATFTP